MFLIYSKTCKNKISKTKVLVNRPTFLPTRDQQVADSIPVRRSAMGGAADFKVGGGVQNSRSRKKMWGYKYKQSKHINELMKKKQESN